MHLVFAWYRNLPSNGARVAWVLMPLIGIVGTVLLAITPS